MISEIILLTIILSPLCSSSRPDASTAPSVDIVIDTIKTDYLRGEYFRVNYTIINWGGNHGEWSPEDDDLIGIKIPKNFSFPNNISVYRNNNISNYFFPDEYNRTIRIPLDYYEIKSYYTNVSYYFCYLPNKAILNGINLKDSLLCPEGWMESRCNVTDCNINITNRYPHISQFYIKENKTHLYCDENVTLLCRAEDPDGSIIKWILLDKYGNTSKNFPLTKLDNNTSKFNYNGSEHELGAHSICSIVIDEDNGENCSAIIPIVISPGTSASQIPWDLVLVLLALAILTIIAIIIPSKNCIANKWITYIFIFLILISFIYIKDIIMLILFTYFLASSYSNYKIQYILSIDDPKLLLNSVILSVKSHDANKLRSNTPMGLFITINLTSFVIATILLSYSGILLNNETILAGAFIAILGGVISFSWNGKYKNEINDLLKALGLSSLISLITIPKVIENVWQPGDFPLFIAPTMATLLLLIPLFSLRSYAAKSDDHNVSEGSSDAGSRSHS